MTRWILAMLIGLMLVGCDEDAPVSEQIEAARDQVAEQVDQAVDTVQQTAEQLQAQAIERTQQAYATAREHWDHVLTETEADRDRLTGAALEQYTQLRSEVESRISTLDAQIDQVQADGLEQWTVAQAETSAMLRQLGDLIDQAADQIQPDDVVTLPQAESAPTTPPQVIESPDLPEIDK